MGTLAEACILALWIVLGLATVFRRRPAPAREVLRGPGWSWGLALEALSIGILWVGPRPSPGLLRGALAIVLGAASVAVMLVCQRVLGRQFAYQARLVEDHRLIAAGPYGYVRHPIYTALFGLVLATGLVLSRWPVILLSVALYLGGTAIRVRAEERLLRAQFGPEFDEYARRVSAFVPIPRRGCKL
jgi:protein-S-isoprenylcysteine O-methyltransferase Ste14